MPADSESCVDTAVHDSSPRADNDVGSTEQCLHAVLAEQRQDWTTGRRTPAVEWLGKYPALSADPALAAEIVYHEFVLRQELGEAPDWDEYLRQSPPLAAMLQLLRQADQLVEQAFAPTAPATPPERFGNYELLEPIGRGGMGVVYKARQLGLDRTVAVKVIRADTHPGEEERKRFDREARAVALLSHPHIVQIHEVGEAGGQPFLVLEFVAGGSLKDQLDGTPLPASRAADLVGVLARAMHYAHGQGVIHRDLKPSNVLLAVTPEGEVPKVTDFGLAKRLDASGDTRSGAILGTPSYMAPEQVDSKERPIDPRTDVYGQGAILYELLTGRPPFRAESELQTLQQVLHMEPVSPRLLNPAVPRDVETICLKCLRKEPDERYVSAAELADDLERWRQGEPIKARRIGPLSRAWCWCRRKPVIAGLAAALAVALLVGIPIILYQWREAELARNEAEVSDDQLLQMLNELIQSSTADPLLMGRSQKLPDFETLHKAESHLADLLRKKPDNIRLRIALTNVRGSLGALCLFWGRIDQANVHYQAAQELWEAPACPNPDHPECRAWLATTYTWQAGAANQEGGSVPWIRSMLRAYELSQELAEEQPDNRARLEILEARRYVLLGVRDGGPVAEAILGPLEDERASLLERTKGENPASPALRKCLALVCLMLGELHLGNHLTSEAVPYWQQAYERSSVLARDQPDDLLVQLNLALCCYRLMAELPSDPYYRQGVALFEQAAKRLTALESQEPDGQWRHLLLETHCSLAGCHWKAARRDLAEQVFQERVRPRLARYGDFYADDIRAAGWLDYLLRDAVLVGENNPAALAIVRTAASLAERYAESPSRDPAYCESLAQMMVSISAWLCRLGEPAEALWLAQQARSLGEGLRRAAPGVPGCGFCLDSVWERIAKAQWALGRRDDALAAFQKSAEAQRQVFERAPSVRRYRANLSRCYERLAYYCSQHGKRAMAAEAQLKRAKLWPQDKEQLLKVSQDFRELAEALGKDRASLSAEEEAERRRYLIESQRLAEAAHQAAAARPQP
jgi:tetratricopeptide (TPR) repeat protein